MYEIIYSTVGLFRSDILNINEEVQKLDHFIGWSNSINLTLEYSFIINQDGINDIQEIFQHHNVIEWRLRKVKLAATSTNVVA